MSGGEHFCHNRNAEYNKKKQCRTNKLLTDRMKKINSSIFCHLHMYVNNTYRYFSMVFRVVPKNSSTRPISCTSSPNPLQTRTFFGKSHLALTTRVVCLPRSARTRSGLKNSSPTRPSSCDSEEQNP